MNMVKAKNTGYSQLKSQAIERQPIRVEGFLSDIKMKEMDRVEFRDKSLKLSRSARTELLKLLRIHRSIDELLEETVGKENRDLFIYTVQKAIGAKRRIPVIFLIDKGYTTIDMVTPNNRHVFGNDLFFTLAEVVLENYDLTIRDMHVGKLGEVRINALSENSCWQIGNFSDENFSGGISLTNDYQGGISFSAYLQRLVCANGMIAKHFSDTFKMKQVTPKAINTYYDGVRSLAKRHFEPVGFKEKVLLSKNTNASLNELETAFGWIKNSCNISNSEIEKWIPLGQTIDAYKEHGIRVRDLSAAKKKNAKTGTNMWDVINGVTHFASHDSRMIENQQGRNDLLIKANEMLAKEYDDNNLVDSPY